MVGDMREKSMMADLWPHPLLAHHRQIQITWTFAVELQHAWGLIGLSLPCGEQSLASYLVPPVNSCH